MGKGMGGTLALLSLAAAVVPASAALNATFLASITSLLDTLLVDYDNKLRPDIGGTPASFRAHVQVEGRRLYLPGAALQVTVHMSVLNIGPVSEKNMVGTPQ